MSLLALDRLSGVVLIITTCSALTCAITLKAQVETQAPEPVPIGSLRTQGDEHLDLQTIRGVITQTGSPIYLQDKSGGIEVRGTATSSQLRVGDEIEVTGRVTLGRYSSSMGASSLRVLRVRVPDPPLSVTPAQAASGDYDKQFIETAGTLVSRTQQDGKLVLLLRSTHQLFTAEQNLSFGGQGHVHWEIGSVLRVRGTCLMNEGASSILAPFHLLLRSPQDIEVLAGPPFWTGSHVLLLSAGLVALGFVIVLAAMRMERWRFSLILEERKRMAHDLHDSLAQSFAGIAFQLHSVRLVLAKRPPDPILQEHVQLAISMVSHSHEDARRTIATLKPSDNVDGDLLESLQLQASILTQGGSVKLTVECLGEPVELPAAVKQALLRIGHEAITNAVRHAAPATIDLRLTFEQAFVRLCVRDDGCGFQPNSRATRGFGLLGARSRAASQGGTLTVESRPHAGCSLEVSFPIQGRRNAWQTTSFLKRFVG